MLSKIKLIENHLHEAIVLENSKEKEAFEQSQLSWKNILGGINFWHFLSINYLHLNRFFTLLDVETGPDSGWERFAELLGLIFWEDRKWCTQYHGGLGPTRTALLRLIERNIYDKELSLAAVIEIIEGMDRLDILHQIDWNFLIENFWNKFSGIADIEKDMAHTFSFELRRDYKHDHLLKSECNFSISTVNQLDENIKMVCNNRAKELKTERDHICVLFSYASDGEAFAQKVANFLRSGENGFKIKVLMIGENRVKAVLASDYSNIIHKWFHQVRYIVPILSPEYMNQIQNIDSMEDILEDISLYNRFIYRLALDQFAGFGSRNLRCRPICPKEFISTVKMNVSVRTNGLLSPTWSCNTSQDLRNFSLVLSDEPLM